MSSHTRQLSGKKRKIISISNRPYNFKSAMKHVAGRIYGKGTFSCIVTAALFSQVFGAKASIVSMTDGNSSVNIDPASQAGMSNWTVDGANQVNQQWFWYRVGSGTAASIDTIGTPTVTHPTLNSLNTTYANSQLSVEAVFTLTGGAVGSGNSGMGEQIRIQNLSGSAMTFHFFQYSDFNTGGAGNTVVQLGQNINHLFNEALVTSGNVSITENFDTSIVPGANHGEAALFSSTKDALNTTANYTLNDNPTIGPGHSTWAFEWD